MVDLSEPVTVGRLKLRNRVAMAAMTRNRAGAGEIATPMMAEYYRQRASAGLIITEAIQPSLLGQSYITTPGLWTDGQTLSWKRVTEAVHAAGGLIYAQLLHGGRIGHPDVRGGLTPQGPSPVAAAVKSHTADGPKDNVVPDAMTEEDIATALADYAAAARNAVVAGFDGVELHGANGYLVQQFLSTRANLRSDRWGGTPEGRVRFAVAATKAIADAVGAERTALRISPGSTVNDIDEGDSEALYSALLSELAPLDLAFLDLRETAGHRGLTRKIRAQWRGTLMLNPHRDETPLPPHEAARDALEQEGADVVAFGSAFISNPDLPRRIALGGPYAPSDPATYYGGDEHGYTDYPPLP